MKKRGACARFQPSSYGYRQKGQSMACPKCSGKLYVEDDEQFSGEEDGYVVMCFDCAWVDKYAWPAYNLASDRLDILNKPTKKG